MANDIADPDDIITEADDESSSSHSDQTYKGWVASVISPFGEFIDLHVNPRHLYVQLQKIAEGPGGTILHVARLAPANFERRALPHDLTEYDEDDIRLSCSTLVAIKSVPIMPTGSSRLWEVLRELRIMSSIQSENILHMDALYVDPVEDALWIRMELMSRTLSSVIELNGAGLVLSDRMIAGCIKDVS
jgi:p21-activated kinase 1